LAEPGLGKDDTAEMAGRLGNPCCFRAVGNPLGKFPEFCEARDQPATGSHRGQHEAGGARLAQVACNGCHALPEHVRSATVVSQRDIDRAQQPLCSRLLDAIPARRGMDQRTLTVLDGRLIVAHAPDIVG
jgi:hypothetical protein